MDKRTKPSAGKAEGFVLGKRLRLSGIRERGNKKSEAVWGPKGAFPLKTEKERDGTALRAHRPSFLFLSLYACDFVQVSQWWLLPLNTMPRAASTVTVVPLFSRCVADSAPTITGLSSARPTTAAWEFSPPCSVTMPEQDLMSGSRWLVV